MLNNEWLEAMLQQIEKENVGAVGAKLLYPDDTLQHAGVVVGILGLAGHAYKHMPNNHEYNALPDFVHNVTAVTGACLMIRNELFQKIGGFDENLGTAYNDVDLCLKLRGQGYFNIFTPHAILRHYESMSRGYENTTKKLLRLRNEAEYMRQKWGEKVMHDPYYNPNLTTKREDFSLKT